MNKTLPTLILFLTSQIGKLKIALVSFLKIQSQADISILNTTVNKLNWTVKTCVFALVFLSSVSVVNAATITSTGTGGNWSSPSTWVGGVVPTAADDVIISSGTTVTVTANAFAKSISVLGTTGNLTINDKIILIIYGNVNVASGASFNAGTNNNDSAIIKVYGNFTNNGTANFWKSIVVIAGDLITASTILQNNGDIIVGGNVSGTVTGGGNGYVYPVNPDATNTLTGTTNNQPVGTIPSDSTLLALMNEVIFAGACSFTVNNILNQTGCPGFSAIFSVTTSAATPSYKWQVQMNSTGSWVDLTNTTPYSGVSTADLTISDVTGKNNNKYRAIVTNAGCSVARGVENTAGVLTVTSANSAGAASSTPTLCINTALTAITHTTTGATGIGSATGLPAGVTAAWSSNTITISGTPTASGTFNYSIPLTGGCGSVNATGTLTVNANTVSNASLSPTVCVNNAIANITHTTTGATGIGTAIGLPAGVTAAWASNTITISGTPTASGTFNYSIPLAGGCGSVLNATGTITVNPNNSVGAASSSPNLCISMVMTNITHATTGATGIGTAIGLPAGVTAAWASNTITISGTPTAPGIFNYSIPLAGGCGSVLNATGTITVNPNNTVGAASSSPNLCISAVMTNITHATTGATGIGTASGLPAGVTAAWASNTITISGTPTAPGIFNYSIPLAGGCGSVLNATGTITVNPNNTVGAASSSPNLCISAVMTNITHATTGATGIGTASGLPAGVTAAWTSNTITISGTPTASGIFNYSIPLTGGCGSVLNATGIITVNPNLLASVSIAASPSTAICSGTSVTFTATPTNGGTTPAYQWKLNGSDVGSNSATYTNSALANGDSVTCVMASNATPCLTGSPATSNMVTITVSSLPAAPSATATSQPTCAVPTGVITVTAPIAGMNYSIDGSNYSNTTGIFNNVAVGSNYKVTAQNALGCTSPESAAVVISGPVTNTWDGTKWSKTNNTTPPTSGDIIVFNGNYSGNVDIQGCSCQVNAGFTVTIPSGKTMTITNAVSASGTLIFEDGASLVQVNDGVVNSGIITYKRNSTPMKDFDYTRWSSPVLGQNLKLLSPNTLRDKYLSYDLGNWVTILDGNGVMNLGKGYSIRVPRPQFWPVPAATTYVQPVQFVGVPNNGAITIPAQGAGKYNLIGNPYPSAIDADEFILQNGGLTNGALYFWTHNTAIKPSGSFYVYSSSDYATYTLTGGVGTGVGNFVDANNNGVFDSGEVVVDSNAPNGKIAAGEAFFVVSTGTANIVFNNSMRNTSKVLASGSNSQFFRMSQTKKMAAIEKNRVWLNLANSEGAFKQLLVGYITGATNEIDNLYDGVSINGNAYVDFYSVNKEKKLTIQGRALPFDKTDKVPLGYRTTISGTFQISFSKADGVLATQTVFLEDNVTKAVHNLKDGPYSFTTTIGTFNDRFVLVYVDKTAIVTPPVVVEPPVAVEPPVVVNPPIVIEPPVAVNPPVVVDPPVLVEPPVAVNPPLVIEPPVAVEPPVTVNPPVVVDPPVAVEPPVVVNPPVVIEPPVAVEPPVTVNPPVVVEPPVVVNPPVVIEPPVAVEPPVVVSPPIVVTPPVVIDPPVVVNPPIVVTPPVVIEPPVIVEPPVVVNPPVVVSPPVAVEPPVVVDPPIVVVPPVVDVPVSSLDPTIEKPTDDKKNKSVIVSVSNHQIKINSFDETMAIVMLYDLRGRLIYEKNGVKNNEFVIQGLSSTDQFLIVMIQLTNGKWVTKEIIFKN